MLDPDIQVGSSTENPTDKLQVNAAFSICDEWFVVERYLSDADADDEEALAVFAKSLIAGAIIEASERFAKAVAEQVKANVDAYRQVNKATKL